MIIIHKSKAIKQQAKKQLITITILTCKRGNTIRRQTKSTNTKETMKTMKLWLTMMSL